jgi:cytochrome oxidase Cu insertion factor (SCO1/SenC/PrrC family)
MQNEKQLAELEMQRKGRMVFILLVIFFVVPIVVVLLMVKLNWKPIGASLGELVQPARPLITPLDLKDSEGAVLSKEFWKEKWSVVYVAGECEKACLAKLHDMRQLHVSLYKDIQRAQRVLITTTQDVKAIKHDFPDLIIINHPLDNISVITKQFQVNGENVTMGNRLYLVDSLGNLMMSYKPTLPLADVRKDITHLLRYSWAG